MSKLILVDAYKLGELYDRICEKDSEEEALDAFRGACSSTYSSGDYSAEELLEEGANLEGTFYTTTRGYNDEFFMFEGKSENAAYNKVLREWCENTDRKIKKKK